MPRLAVLCEFPTLHGGERSLLATMSAVVEAGFEPIFIAPAAGPLAETLQERGIAHQPFTWRTLTSRPPLDELRAALADTLRHVRPDLIHANSLSTGRVSGPVVESLRLRSVAHLRDIMNLPAAQIADLNRHLRLLAVSAATRDSYLPQGLDAARTYVLYNGVDLDEFQPREPTGYLHREFGLESGVPLVGTIGQLVMRKGHDIFAKAAGRSDIHYLVIGTRFSEKQEAIEHEEHLRRSFPPNTHFLPNRDDVSRVLNELTLLIHPARQEPLGRVLLEAAASGVAVIATDVGGTREIFSAETGSAVLIAPNDSQSLAETIDRLLGDPAERRRLGQAARRRAVEAFDIRNSVRSLIAHYRELVG